jgi:hypothetical protein
MLMKKEETPYIVPKYPHFLAVWTKFETFYFQIFSLKKRGNLLIKGELSSSASNSSAITTTPFTLLYASLPR